MEKKIGVLWIGGDGRQTVAENAMYAWGWNTSVCLGESPSAAKGSAYMDWKLALKKNKVLIFPLPVTKKRVYLNSSNDILISDILQHIQPGSLVLGGRLSDELCAALSEKGIRFFDYYREELQIRNALPTAESAIGIALLESPRMLCGSKAFVVGYGKIGKILAQKLQVLGVHVTVGARKPSDLALANSFGHTTLSIAKGIPQYALGEFDFIFNTAPVRLFGREEMNSMKKNSLFTELASFPYGMDFEVAKEYGFRAILAESLPGKYSPISAGEILAEAVVQILEKEEISP